MTAERSRQYWLPAIVGAAIGFLLFGLMDRPFGLLAPVAGDVSVCLGEDRLAAARRLGGGAARIGGRGRVVCR